jgi:riboflavin kinase/FMN adenylyltransferase
MKAVYGISALEELQIDASTVTVGTFDGVHKGHRVLLDRLIVVAAENKTPSVILTFDPHPQMVLGTRGRMEILNTTEEKLALLAKVNPDIVVILEFNQQLASLEAEDFIERILMEDLKIKHFVVGYDHNFGKSRRGDFELVKSNADKYNYTGVERRRLRTSGKDAWLPVFYYRRSHPGARYRQENRLSYDQYKCTVGKTSA